MEAKVSIVMGSVSDLKIMEGAAQFLNEMKVSFEINALSAHRAPQQVAEYANGLEGRGVKVVIAGAGGAAHLPGVIAAVTPVPVIGVPIKSSNSLDGWDSVLSILQMPAGIPVATVALDGARNAGILAVQILALSDEELMHKFKNFKSDLTQKVLKANEELKNVKYEFKIDR
jgi:5-(carboxyamino)imidazole ribonucleotide mutase